MQKTKYYTPTLDEFHVGFEYEEYCFEVDMNMCSEGECVSEFINDKSNHYNTFWKKQIYGGFLPNHPQTYIDNKKWRVKHLDREDIENWFNVDITKNYQKPDLIIYETDFNSNLKEYVHIVYDTKSYRVEIENCNDETLFTGTIKNKSELKRILTQIGVL